MGRSGQETLWEGQVREPCGKVSSGNYVRRGRLSFEWLFENMVDSQGVPNLLIVDQLGAC